MTLDRGHDRSSQAFEECPAATQSKTISIQIKGFIFDQK